MPDISIVLPTYNVASYIERCLNSCIAQTYRNIEIVIVDDVGSDDSIKLAQKYANADSRIKIIKNMKNLGTFHARRIGVENSTAPYILFLDPDDEIELNTAERISSQLKKNPDLVLYGSRKIPKPKIWQQKPKVPSITDSINRGDFINNIFGTKGLSFGIEGKVVKRTTLFDAYKLLDISNDDRLIFGEDALLFFAILIKANEVISIPDIMYIYHINSSSVTRVIEPIKIKSNLEQLEVILKKMKKIKLNSEIDEKVYEKIYEKLYIDSLILRIQLENVYSKNIKNYFKIYMNNRELKNIIKLGIYILTYGNKKP